MKEMIYQKEHIVDVLHSGKYRGRKFAILNLGTHPTAYVELKEQELLRSKSYNDYDLSVHGGFTFLNKSYWDDNDTSIYIGWDYAHSGDYAGYYTSDDWHWACTLNQYTTEQIFQDVMSVIEQFEEAEWIDVSEPHYILKVKED